MRDSIDRRHLARVQDPFLLDVMARSWAPPQHHDHPGSVRVAVTGSPFSLSEIPQFPICLSAKPLPRFVHNLHISSHNLRLDGVPSLVFHRFRLYKTRYFVFDSSPGKLGSVHCQETYRFEGGAPFSQ